ncbi:MAG: uracil-DNA glycosylase [Candidatus Lambdaproteobacteria bacterium]|nr:uracil-DNA glycosylase [Candidatus Lambdaproteobacteria bacterium]
MPEMPLSQIKTLESLQAQFRNCMACKLGRTRTNLVFGVGHASPRLMFIGEGPGAEEDQQGLPFVGRAGALLTGLIAALGLTREDVYIANVVKCRPPGNRAPEPDEVLACRRILERQIELLNPALIVSLGNVPLKALNPAAGGITRERGRAFPFREWTVLPTFHPSYLLRNQQALGDCWADFKAAFARAYPET